MKMRVARTLAGAVMLTMAMAPAAVAGPVTFTFDSLANGANSTAIQTYMNSVLTAGATVTVYAGATATNSYTGDGHVVGPTSGTTTTSLTLGNSNNLTGDTTNGVTMATVGATDTFLINNNVAGTGNNNGDRIVFGFNNFTIAAGSTISFNYEIFPDGTCPSLSNCGTNQANLPDLIFAMNGTNIGTKTGVVGTSSSQYYDNSPMMANETAPQAMGVWTYTVTSNLVNPTLSFIDWPSTIGIDNLTITPPSTQAAVPEPGTLLLLGTGVVAAMRRRRVARKG
jgi:hypothetical protein